MAFRTICNSCHVTKLVVVQVSHEERVGMQTWNKRLTTGLSRPKETLISQLHLFLIHLTEMLLHKDVSTPFSNNFQFLKSSNSRVPPL